MPSHFFNVPYAFVPDNLSAEQMLQRLTELVEAADAEKESSSETFAQDTFRRALHRIFDFVHNDTSLAVTWLTNPKNRVLFRRVIADEDRLMFFKVHLKNCYIVDMLSDAGLLSLISDLEERTDFVCRVLCASIPKTDAWIPAAMSARISADTLALPVLYWLRHPEDFDGGDAFAARFLRTGSGPSIKTPNGIWTLEYGCSRLWHLFRDQEKFWEALKICAQREPNVFFEAPAENDVPVSHKVQLRGKEQADEVLQEALANLESRDGLSAQGLDRLTKRLKRSVIRRPGICPLPFLVKFAMDYIDLDGPNYFNAYVGQITPRCTDYAADLVESFVYIRAAKEDKNGSPYIPGRIALIEQTLRRNAAMHGVNPSTLEL